MCLIKEGFIHPSVPARGQGTKAVFSRNNVYAVALFSDLLDAGFRRQIAATHMRKFSKVFRKNFELVLYRRIALPGGCMMHCSPVILIGNNNFAVMAGEVSFTGDVGDTHEITEAMKSIDDIGEWGIFFIVNMKKLKNKVDTQLSQLD